MIDGLVHTSSSLWVYVGSKSLGSTSRKGKTGGKHWRGTPMNDSMWPMRSYFLMRLIYARKLILEGQKFRFLVWFPHNAMQCLKYLDFSVDNYPFLMSSVLARDNSCATACNNFMWSNSCSLLL
jgi:hypothetical protein